MSELKQQLAMLQNLSIASSPFLPEGVRQEAITQFQNQSAIQENALPGDLIR